MSVSIYGMNYFDQGSRLKQFLFCISGLIHFAPILTKDVNRSKSAISEWGIILLAINLGAWNMSFYDRAILNIAMLVTISAMNKAENRRIAYSTIIAVVLFLFNNFLTMAYLGHSEVGDFWEIHFLPILFIFSL